MLTYLSARYSVDCVCVDGAGIGADRLEEYRVSKNIGSIMISKSGSSRRGIKELIASYLCRMPMSVYRNYRRDLRDSVKNVLAQNNYDVILVDHFLMACYVPEPQWPKVVFHQHNAEYVMWRRYASIQGGLLKSVILYAESCRIERFEKKYCNSFRITLAAPNDIEALAKLGIPLSKFVKTLHLPNDAGLAKPLPVYKGGRCQLIYVGTLSWQANDDGLQWFLRCVWPLVIRDFPDMKLAIAGKGASDSLVQEVSKSQNVELLGFVEDLDNLYQCATAFICPLRFGSGIKVKIVEAMYRGCPTITTAIGAEGLAISNERHLMIAADAEEFRKCIMKLVSSKEMWERLSAESRAWARENLDWETNYRLLDEAINGIH